MALDADADKGKAALEISVRGEPADAQALRADFFALAKELNVDIAFQRTTCSAATAAWRCSTWTPR
jgi:phosphoserine phosphatase